MDTNEIIQKIISGLDDEVLCIAYTGSSIFCTNCKDLDLFVITKGAGGRKYLNNYSEFSSSGIDVFAWSIDYIQQVINYRYVDVMNLYLLGLTDKNIVYGANPFPSFNLFDHKADLLDTMIKLCENKYCSAKYRNMKNKDMCLSRTYWLFANYFALVNNSLEFTTEQKEILQKCHDNELPRTYADELYQNLVEMKNNL